MARVDGGVSTVLERMSHVGVRTRMSGGDLFSSVIDDCSRPGDARIAPRAKKFCDIRANYDTETSPQIEC